MFRNGVIMQNFFEEARELAKNVKDGGDLSDLNKQADLVLDLIEEKEVVNQSSIDYIKENYDIRNGYCVCDGEVSVLAQIYGVSLAHDICITTKSKESDEKIISACVDAAEEYFSSNNTFEEFKDFALNYSEQSEILTKI